MSAQKNNREHEKFMRLALHEAKKGLGFTSPNPLVGAIAVKHGKILATAYHKHYGGLHAEVSLLQKLTTQQARGATIYVNLEPCCHVGKTAPCTQALIQAGVARVVLGHKDPNPLINGQGIAELRRAGIEIITGILESEAREMNAPFLTYITENRPWVLLKIAQSLDGRIALANGKSRWITGAESRREVHKLRAHMDAVLVGVQTVVDDNPELTVRHVRGRNPVRVIFDSQLRIPLKAKVLSAKDSEKTWIFTTAKANAKKRRAIEDRGISVVICKSDIQGHVSVKHAARLLAKRGITSLLVEGGGTMHSAWLKAGICDKFVIAIAPKLIGAEGRAAVGNLQLSNLTRAPEFAMKTTRYVGNDLWIELNDVHGNH